MHLPSWQKVGIEKSCIRTFLPLYFYVEIPVFLFIKRWEYPFWDTLSIFSVMCVTVYTWATPCKHLAINRPRRDLDTRSH